MNDRLIDTAELAELLGVGYSTVAHNWKAWGIPSVKLGTSRRFRYSAVMAWLESRKEAA